MAATLVEDVKSLKRSLEYPAAAAATATATATASKATESKDELEDLINDSAYLKLVRKEALPGFQDAFRVKSDTELQEKVTKAAVDLAKVKDMFANLSGLLEDIGANVDKLHRELCTALKAAKDQPAVKKESLKGVVIPIGRSRVALEKIPGVMAAAQAALNEFASIHHQICGYKQGI